jgi:HSP20 family molecular chaperone IbpA
MRRSWPPSKFGESGLHEWSQHLEEIMDEMLRRTFVQFRDYGAWRPATNVYETRAAYHVCVDLAGVQREQIQVHCISPTRLTIDGCRPQPRPTPDDVELSIHVLEVDEGRFQRQIELPNAVDAEGIEARYDKGFLWIMAPKTAP